MNGEERKQQFFTENLLYWHTEENNRQLPWKQTRDPYKIWLSEIILQQTRVEQGTPYYLRFVEKYPDVASLANAPDEEVFRLWQGLGYYSRCRNLLKAARFIRDEYGSIFPDKYEQIRALPGVGDYTAAAIASFAFDLPHAVVDGNVYRVLSRFFGIDTPIDSSQGKKEFALLARQILPQQAAIYNQSIMDYGALVCKPAAPLCIDCGLSEHCTAYKNEWTSWLPVKEKKLKVKERHFHYFMLEHEDHFFIRQRNQKDIWQHLHEPYLIEHETNFRESEAWEAIAPYTAGKPEKVTVMKQRLTHQQINSTFYRLKLTARPQIGDGTGFWLTKNMLDQYAFPRTIISFFSGNEYI